APDLVLRTPLGQQRLDGGEDQLESLLFAILLAQLAVLAITVCRSRGGVTARARGARALSGGSLARAAAGFGLLAHQVVVVNELVAVGDQQVGSGVFHADTDHT